MNFSSMASLDLRDVCTSKDCGEEHTEKYTYITCHVRMYEVSYFLF